MKIIDLTRCITEDMPMYPGTNPPKLNVAFCCEEDGFVETLMTFYSHTGTHIDAPAHISQKGLSLDKYPIEHFIGKALIIDCRSLKSGEKITMHFLESKGDLLLKVEFILFFTGHCAQWGKLEYFQNYPILSNDVIEWINQHKLKGIGIDAPSFDPVFTANLENGAGYLHIHHAILNTQKTLLIENLCNLEAIGYELFLLFALPIFTLNADGAPARVVAVINE